MSITKRDINKNSAVEGNMISFTYKGIACEGIVRKVYENSVLVTITQHDKIKGNVHLENETIVNHKRYTVL